jgi:hypothetical protein
LLVRILKRIGLFLEKFMKMKIVTCFEAFILKLHILVDL